MPITLDATTGLELLGTVFTQFTTWMGTLMTTLLAQPLFLIPVAVFCVFAVIRIIKAVIS